jgi:hypothetical protein
MPQNRVQAMKFLDPDDPFFSRAWVRWVTVLLPTVWGIVEFAWIGSPFWGLLFLAAAAYAGWALFFERGRKG